MLTEFTDVDVPLAIASSSASKPSPQHLITTLLWVCVHGVHGKEIKFPIYLNAILDYEHQDLLDKAQVKIWAAATPEEILATAASGSKLTANDITRVQSSKGFVAFLNYLDRPEEEDEEDEEEDEEGDEEEEN